MTEILSREVLNAISPKDDGRMLVVCVGNPFRGDDSAGPYIAGKIKNSGGTVLAMDAGEKPEDSITEAELIKPSKVVMIDAADFGGARGEVRVIPIDSIPENRLSTHTFPLNLIARIIESDIKAQVSFIGIQSDSFELGSEMSEEVKKSSDAIADHFNSIDR